jgi:outer membrane lipase/esterase
LEIRYICHSAQQNIERQSQAKENYMSKKRILLSLVLAGLYLFPGVFARAQAYTTIVVFGDSLSDTGNDAAVSFAKYGATYAVPTPNTGYTQGSFTDGLDTSPAALNYTGVWVKQLAALLPAKPSLTNSLAGGTDYAYGFGTTDVGTSEFDYGPGNVLSFNVNNMGQQVTDYLATNPTINNKVLFVVWGGANDLINATSSADIVAAAQRDAGIVQRLIAAGATEIMVPNLPPLGLVPRFNSSPSTSTEPTEAAAGFNQALAEYLAGIIAADPDPTLHIYPLDVYTIFNTIVGPPIAAGFANVTASSQFTSVNPDTYLFWDDLHPTTYGHSILAANALTLVGTPIVTTAAVTSNNIDANLNASVTLTASITSTKGTAIGYVTFLDGTTALGSALLSGSTTVATASYTSSALTAGTHNITVSYSGENGYLSSTSSVISEVVTAPAFSSQVTTNGISVVSGASVVTDLTLTPVGGYTGTVTLACATSAPHMSCLLNQTSMTFNGNNVAQSALLTISTMSSTTSALDPSARPASAHGGEVMAAFLLFPSLGFLGLAGLRKRRSGVRTLGPLLIVAIVSGATLLGLSGCGNSNAANPNDTKPGSYSVQVTETAGTAITTQTLTIVVTQ